jgi:hypothetical protein
VTGLEELHGGGAPSSVLDIVVMGDGYTESQQDDYNEAVDRMVGDLLAMEPFQSLDCAFNVWRINLVTAEEGTSVLGVHIGGEGQPSRYIQGNADECLAVCERAEVPGYDVIFVLVHSDQYAAWTDLTNSITYMTDRYPWGRIMAHELGHSIAGLGDEYSCKICDPGVYEDQQYPAGSPDPPEPNLSATADKTLIPWEPLITTTQLPTSFNAVLDTCTTRSAVGAYEGGGYYAQGIYRPEQFCLMDRWMCENENFCVVCLGALKTRLEALCEAGP